MQSLLVLAHEYAHSTAAWALGYMPTPFTVVWGNPLTIVGWDEGVPYDRLFPAPGNWGEAVVGGLPLFLQASLALVGFYWLEHAFRRQRRWLFLAGYWFVVINLAELVAYVWMRPFILTGDTGRFNHGMNSSPWWLLLAGSVFLLGALWRLVYRSGAQLDTLTDGSRLEHRALSWSAGFVLFLWASGLRLLALYPAPPWQAGLIGVVAFFLWLGVDQALLARLRSIAAPAAGPLASPPPLARSGR